MPHRGLDIQRPNQKTIMLTILILAPLLLLLALALLPGWLFWKAEEEAWKAEEEARAKVFDSSLDHTKQR